MAQGVRLSRAQRDAVWRLWCQGESLRSIAALLELGKPTVTGVVRSGGGVTPRPSRARESALTLVEREAISRGLVAGLSLRAISRELGRAPSTISREVAAGGGRQEYRAVRADARAREQRRRPKACKLARYGWLRGQVARRLRQGWTPQQIAGWLAQTHPDDDTRRVSHETIYVSLFVQARGVLREELVRALKSGRTMRVPQAARRKDRRGQIPNMTLISERPAEAADRAVPGHWEGDLIEGANNSAVATLVERRSRFMMLIKVPSKRSGDVVPAVARRIRRLPTELKNTVTWDRGKEMSQHVNFTVATGITVYFADPHSPWQRPTNENSNKLAREYLPRDVDLSQFTQRQLDAMSRKLNARPRKVLNYSTPTAILAEVLP